MVSACAHADYCIEQWACVEVDTHHEGRYVFWLVNAKPYPFTATLVVKGNNLTDGKRNNGRYEVTRVVDGNERIRVLELTTMHSHKPSSYSDDFFWSPGDMHARHDDNAIYYKPFAPGQHYPIVQGFGGRYSHTGSSRYAVDFAMPVGTPVHAARAGMVIDIESRHSRGGPSRRYARFANYVVIMHDDGTTGEYYHLKQHGVTVSEGQRVSAGDLLGYSGNTGFSSLPHLHFAVYRARPFGNFESLPFRLSR